jgi:hypothetical protein
MLRKQWSETVESIDIKTADDEAERTMLTFTLYNWMALWLGCLEVVAEGFEHGYEYDPRLLDTRLSELLASKHRAKLKGFRNKIFHPEPFNHASILAVIGELRSFEPWAEELTDEFERFFRQYLR